MDEQPNMTVPSGVFRTRMRGFDKQAVLAYIDMLVGQHAEALAAQESEMAALREESQTLRQALEQVKELTAEMEAMSERVQRTAQLESEYQRLQENVAAAAALQAEHEQTIAALTDENRRYEALIGNVGSFLVELHALGQQFLETAYQRSEQCLTAAWTAVDSLAQPWTAAARQIESISAQLADTRQVLAEQSEAAGLRLHELVQQLEDTAIIEACHPDSHERPQEDPS